MNKTLLWSKVVYAAGKHVVALFEGNVILPPVDVKGLLHMNSHCSCC